MDLPALVDHLHVTSDPDEADCFIGLSPAERERQVYGGQFLAQAIMAAAGTVEAGRVPHSLHAYFVRTGAAQTPIRYHVDRVRDGRNFSHRSIVATQDTEAGTKEVFRQIMSFQIPTSGLAWQKPAPVPDGFDPATHRPYRDWVEELSDSTTHPWFSEQTPIDIRLEDGPAPRPRRPLTDDMRIWMKPTGQVENDDPVLHAALLAWISDKTISDVTMYPHGGSWTDDGADILSLDHTMYFFEPARADQWVLFTHETPATGGGRGLARGDLITLDGRRIGALAQEALLVTPDQRRTTPPSATTTASSPAG